jgi:hypothetical protein
MMRQASDDSLAKQQKRDKDVGLIEVAHKDGRRDIVPETQAKRMEKKGFSPAKKSFVMPGVPYKVKRSAKAKAR